MKRPDVKEVESLDALKTLATANPESFAVQMQLAVKLADSGDTAGAIGSAERAAKLLPLASDDNNPHRFIAGVALKAKDTPRAIRALEEVLKIDHADVDSARQLVSLVEPLGDAARTETAYRNVVDVDPFEAKAEAALGRLALQRKDTATACAPSGARWRPIPPTARPRTPIWPRRCWPPARRSQDADAERAGNRAELRPRAGSAAQDQRGRR